MVDGIRFTVTTEPVTPEHHRRPWTPAPDVALSGMWMGAVVQDSTDTTYFGLRGADDFLAGMTHVVTPITGFKKLPRSLTAETVHLFAEYATIDWFEPLTYTDDGVTSTLGYESGRIERDAEGAHWYDATGRWEIHGRNISDVFTVHVPAQRDVEHQVYYRHEVMAATGTIEGVSVSGYLHQDFAYGPTGMVYPQLPIARQLQGMWVSWVCEFDDGRWGGGCFWQGRDGVAFGPGYQVKDGITTAHDDVRATPTLNAAGQVVALRASVGSDVYEFVFDTAGSYIHTFGHVSGHSSGQPPVRSWCWVEHAGALLTPQILDALMAKFALARMR
jgi:hypothetical protein